MIKISIIIPTIGRETLPKVLKGIQACDGYKKIQPEVIVVFDGEKKGAEECLVLDENIKILETGQKIYASGARNLGLDNATGDVIIFAQDDTYPESDWLAKHLEFHKKNTGQGKVLLGKVYWTPELALDPFHKWLLNHAQFSFKKLEGGKIKGLKDQWRFFYTSNISVKRELIEDLRFSDQFTGWGFEDTEFAYRASKKREGINKSLEIIYDQNCRVLHDHPQTLEIVLENTRNARKNALIFEKLHPEVKILPRGGKLLVLKVILFLLTITPKFLLPKPYYWWREWKKAWIKIPSDPA